MIKRILIPVSEIEGPSERAVCHLFHWWAIIIKDEKKYIVAHYHIENGWLGFLQDLNQDHLEIMVKRAQLPASIEKLPLVYLPPDMNLLAKYL